MTEYTISVTREELGILIDALETWPPGKPSENDAAENMLDTFRTMFDGGMP